MKRPMRVVKDEADQRFKELTRATKKVTRLEEELRLATNRKSYENVSRYESQLFNARSSMLAIEKELQLLREEAFAWAPRSVNCEDE